MSRILGRTKRGPYSCRPDTILLCLVLLCVQLCTCSVVDLKEEVPALETATGGALADNEGSKKIAEVNTINKTITDDDNQAKINRTESIRELSNQSTGDANKGDADQIGTDQSDTDNSVTGQSDADKSDADKSDADQNYDNQSDANKGDADQNGKKANEEEAKDSNIEAENSETKTVPEHKQDEKPSKNTEIGLDDKSKKDPQPNDHVDDSGQVDTPADEGKPKVNPKHDPKENNQKNKDTSEVSKKTLEEKLDHNNMAQNANTKFVYMQTEFPLKEQEQSNFSFFRLFIVASVFFVLMYVGYYHRHRILKHFSGNKSEVYYHPLRTMQHNAAD